MRTPRGRHRHHPRPINWSWRIMVLLVIGPATGMAVATGLEITHPETASRLVSDQGIPMVYVGGTSP